MNREELTARITKIVADVGNLSVATLEPDQDLAKAGLDSLDGVEIIMDVEEAFDILLPDEEVADYKVKNIASLVDLVCKRLEIK